MGRCAMGSLPSVLVTLFAHQYQSLMQLLPSTVSAVPVDTGMTQHKQLLGKCLTLFAVGAACAPAPGCVAAAAGQSPCCPSGPGTAD